MSEAGWNSTEFGSTEYFGFRFGKFYNHDYTSQGEKDIIAAAKDYIEKNSTGKVQKLALFLLDEQGAETGTYHMGGSDRWYIDADEIIQHATTIVNLLEEPYEYGTAYDFTNDETIYTPTHSREHAEKQVTESPTDTGLVRRRAAGEWEPVA